VTGTFINASAIVLGGIAGLTLARHLTPSRQLKLKVLLAVLVVYVSASTIWSALKSYSGSTGLKLLGITFLAIFLGNIFGLLLRLQKILSRAGGLVQRRFQSNSSGSPEAPNRFSEGFITCSLLFCVGPMAIIGSIQDGISGNYQTLLVKGLLDGLATMGMVGTFGYGVMLAAIPVLAYQGTLTLLARGLENMLQQQLLVDSINATGGWLVLFTALVILDVRKVPLANYLPSLVIAPLLAKWWLT
jgi:uncharacterized membrane protein YqgA involved in biofilm formation